MCGVLITFFLLLLTVWCVTQKVIIFRFAPFTCGSRSCSVNFLHCLAFFPPVARYFSVIFHHYFCDSRWGLCLYFLAAPPTFPTKSKNERTNEREKESRHCCSLSHTHHTARRWQSHNRVCKNFPPFCHTHEMIASETQIRKTASEPVPIQPIDVHACIFRMTVRCRSKMDRVSLNQN